MTGKRIAIDVVPIRSGQGGTGSGIWTYARELLTHLDRQDLSGLELVCFARKGQLDALGLQQIRVREVSLPEGILFRLLWVQLILPFLCLFYRVGALHKLATETPFFCSAKRITTVHDFYYEYLTERSSRPKLRMYERLENCYFSAITRTCFQKSRAVICVSAATQAEVQLRWPESADRCAVIHHGFPPVTAAISESGPNKRFRFLCVAKFMEHKGQLELLRGFEQLLAVHPEIAGQVELAFRGFANDADYFAELNEAMAASDQSEWVRLIPYDARASESDIYEGANAVVLLSRYEGFGLPVLEAQAAGLPMLCSDLPVLKEVGGAGALFVDMQDADAVAGQLYRLFTEPELRGDLIDKGRANLKRFCWDKAARETLALYRRVVV
jgi:glycosyltransferase involved in cell wall biosynthesis